MSKKVTNINLAMSTFFLTGAILMGSGVILALTRPNPDFSVYYNIVSLVFQMFGTALMIVLAGSQFVHWVKLRYQEERDL